MIHGLVLLFVGTTFPAQVACWWLLLLLLLLAEREQGRVKYRCLPSGWLAGARGDKLSCRPAVDMQ